jgi:membrane protease YdiL (CAAX protease family)
MKRKRSFSGNLTNQETVGGICYLVLQIFFLPGLLDWVNRQLSSPLRSPELNFLFFLINFIAILLIFHDFLGRALKHATRHPALLCQAVILGLAAYYASCRVMDWGISQLAPGYSNYNDQAITDMAGNNYFLMAIGTVVLAPLAEECMFRGLIFGKFRPKSALVAYCASTLFFCAIHVLGYWGSYPFRTLLICFLQYVPTGLILARSYEYSGSIFAPMVIHAAVNTLSFLSLR